MTRRRARLAGVPLTALLAGTLLLAAPTAARAETTLTAPDRVGAAGVVALRATTDPAPEATRLTLRGPGDTAAVVVATNEDTPAVVTGGELAFDLDTRCARYPAAEPCSSPLVARNGVWTVALTGGHQASRQVVVAVPAARPDSVTATPDGPTALVLRWQRGVEPDVRWTLLEGDRTLVADLTPADVCAQGTCEARLSYPAESSRERTVTVRALRACPGCGGEPAGADSAATATLPDAPAPEPGGSPGDGADGGSGAGPDGGGESGDGTVTQPNGQPVPEADRARSAEVFGAFVPRGAGPSVPAGVPAAPGQPQLPSVPGAPAVPDTFDEALDYGETERTVVEETRTPVTRTVTRAIGAVGGALAADRVARTGAGALLLLLVAAHLRVWASSTRPD